MMAPDDALDDVLIRIAEGQPIDWDRVAALSPDADWQARLADLRILAGVAGTAHTDEQEGSPETGGGLVLRERIGRGQGVDVHRAWDSELGRDVAVKVFDADGGAPLAEGRRLARVRHPNVVAVYGVETVGGRVGLVMELVRGDTLAALLDASGPLPAAAAVSITRQVCAATAAVHAAGLLHRDIKAANVMVEPSGRVVLMDLGIGIERCGRPARPAGTPLYVAPEVLVGAPATVRSDVYSIGVLLHLLLTGRYPVEAATLEALRAAHDGRAARPTPAAALPADLDVIVAAAIAVVPARRLPSAESLGRALDDWLERQSRFTRSRGRGAGWAAGLVVLVAGALASVAATRPAPAPEGSAVLVMPFENRTGDPRLAGVLDAVLDRALATAPNPQLASAARVGDALALMHRPPDTPLTREVALEVSARDGRIQALIDGRLERRGSGYRAVIEVVDSGHGSRAASLFADAPSEAALIHAARSLARGIRRHLGDVTRSDAGPELERVTTDSLRALALYTSAYRIATQSTEQTWSASHELVRQAIALDPDLAAAHTWLAWCLYRTGAPASEYRAAADRARALAHRATAWERHWIVGSHAWLLDDLATAVREYEQLVRLQPAHYWGVWNLYNGYLRLDRNDEAADTARQWARLRPNDLNAQYRAANALGRRGDLRGSLPYAASARALASTVPHVAAELDAWTVMVPSLEHFQRRRPAAARDALSVAWAASASAGAQTRDAVARQSAALLLAIGRPRDAESVAQGIADPMLRAFTLADVAYTAGQLDRTRQQAAIAGSLVAAAREPPYWWPWLIVLQIRSGAAQARDAVLEYERRMEGRRHYGAWLNGELAVAERSHAAAVDLLAEARPLFVRGNWNWFLATATLGEALEGLGRNAEATELYEEAIAAGRGEVTGEAGARLWMPMQHRRARLARGAGDVSTAERLERDLADLRADAEPGVVVATSHESAGTGVAAP
jgi:serine/threonine protein kinase/tetratricopeptide (TPR) repeat protein